MNCDIEKASFCVGHYIWYVYDEDSDWFHIQIKLMRKYNIITMCDFIWKNIIEYQKKINIQKNINKTYAQSLALSICIFRFVSKTIANDRAESLTISSSYIHNYIYYSICYKFWKHRRIIRSNIVYHIFKKIHTSNFLSK